MGGGGGENGEGRFGGSRGVVPAIKGGVLEGGGRNDEDMVRVTPGLTLNLTVCGLRGCRRKGPVTGGIGPEQVTGYRGDDGVTTTLRH